MKKLYEVTTAIYDKEEKEYAGRWRSMNIIAITGEEAIKKIKPILHNDNPGIESVDEVKLIAQIDIE